MNKKTLYKGIIAAAAALTVAVAAEGAASLHPVSAEQGEYTLTVNASGEMTGLKEAQTVLDIYKIADAAGTPGTADFTWTPAEGFEALVMDDEDWTAAAQEALRMALTSTNGITVETVQPAVKAVPAGEAVSLADPGLYLVIPHGSGLTDYLVTVKTAEVSGTGEANLATIARSRTAQYTFSPQIVSLPGKEEKDALTDDSGTWLNDMNLVMKYSTSDLYGKLKIQKTLLSFETKDPATFVFRVDGYKDGYDTGERIYSDVVSIVFDGAQIRSAELTDISLDAYVTVTEIYSGTVYYAADGEIRQIQIKADQENKVSFSNDYIPASRGGGSVTNRFSFDREENQWNEPDQVYDTTPVGEKE